MSVRVLIVDDSGFFRRRLSEIIASDPKLTIVGTASNGQEAIEQVKSLKPDVITMDIEMPVMDGITAVRKIMAQQPTPILMLSTWTTQGAKSTLDALDAGAVDYMPKRFEDISSDANIIHQQLCQRLIHLAKNTTPQHFEPKVTTKSSTPRLSSSRKMASPISRSRNTRIVAIGTSTGGPVALQKVLSQLPANFPYPIVLIQHMPATFTPSFAERLNTQCNIHIKQAEDGEALIAGTAYLAPGGMQMLVKGNPSKTYIEIQASQTTQTYKPCVDITLESIANIYPKETLAVILTGMGADGKKGCQRLHELGSTIWAQDEKSSTIYGMPMAIAKAGLADEIFDINDLGYHLSELT
ncbi:MAG: chemotaxis-specific protein-glutamate methyltransferase CheB [Methylophaga sp.]|nr:chemotaxis-specific protein-glutamate methyltransferase CheB [Methylophaga sp.]